MRGIAPPPEERSEAGQPAASGAQASVSRRLHMIGNGHLDVIWLWPQWDGLQEVWATFRSALDRMREHPTFRFSASSAAYYDWVERVDPEMFAEIKDRVSEGRWELVGGWWVEPDCNIPSGEAFVRQALYGQRFFLSRFGRSANVGYNIDSFGHAASLPQLLLKAGLKSYVFLRPRDEELALPGSLFWWEGADGARVLAFRIPSHYWTSAEDLPAHAARCLAEMDGHLDVACFYGVGNHGGGPTRASIAAIDRLGEVLNGVEVKFSSLEAFLDRVAETGTELPVYRGELQHHARGCYSVHSGVKLWNRRAEQQLLTSEKAAVMARCLVALPAPSLEQAWKSALFNQFHDVLAGTSIEPAYEDVRDTYGEAVAVAGRVTHRSLQAIARLINLPQVDGATPVVVFNTHSWPVRTLVELEADRLHEATAIQGVEGITTPLQDVRPLSSEAGNRRRVAFLAEIPPFGYRVYRAVRGSVPHGASDRPDHLLEDDRWRIEIDPTTGFMTSLFDKSAMCEALKGSGGRAVVIRDDSDTWGHDRSRFDQEAGMFQLASMRRVCDGPVKTVIRAESRYAGSRLIQDYTLVHGLDFVLVSVMIDWHEQRRALKLRWRVNVQASKTTYEIPYGHLSREASGEEEPGQAWLDVSGVHPVTGRPYGVSILNNGKHGFDVEGTDIGITVLRSPVYAHHDPRVISQAEEPDVAFTDQGTQRFQYAIVPHADSWSAGRIPCRAAELNQPAIAFWHAGHGGMLPATSSLLAIRPTSVILEALKPAEDGSADTIMRCLESAGEATEARLDLPAWGRQVSIHFAPYEVKTLRIPADPARPVVQTDLLELQEWGV